MVFGLLGSTVVLCCLFGGSRQQDEVGCSCGGEADDLGFFWYASLVGFKSIGFTRIIPKEPITP